MKQQAPGKRRRGNVGRRLKTVLLSLAVYLCITSLLIGLTTYFFLGAPQPLSAGLTAGFIIAVWTLPMVVFVSYFATAQFPREAAVPVHASTAS